MLHSENKCRDMYIYTSKDFFEGKSGYWARGLGLVMRACMEGGEPWEEVSLLGCVLAIAAFILIWAMLGFIALGWAAISFR